jgi:ribosome recycling factor
MAASSFSKGDFMTNTFDIKEFHRRMDGAIQTLKKEFSGLRTGRASPNLLDPVQVDAYGSKMPLSQVATVSAPEPRLLSVQVWDIGMAKLVEKAIRESGLGLNPAAEGAIIRVPLPDLSQERRLEMVKVAGKYAESARIAVRNVRRDGMDTLKKLEKDGKISQDEQKRFEKELQTETDTFVKQIDTDLASKEKEIKTV